MSFEDDEMICCEMDMYNMIGSDEGNTEYQFDFFVIGGGPGGVSAANKASLTGNKIGIADYVKPSSLGTTWGFGGTCVNVGCIPKKLMHFTSLIGELREDQAKVGWDVDSKKGFNWHKMLQTVNNYVEKTSWQTQVPQQMQGVTVYNKLASQVDAHTIKLVDSEGKEEIVTSDKILIAVGGRPSILDFEGCKENCITSDDIFWQKQAPGKTLQIGAGYIAMECGGFLKGMGYEVSIMVRSTPLRNFDQDMVKRVVIYMESMGVNFLSQTSPTRVDRLENGKLLVHYQNPYGDFFEEFDTVLLATGRTADTKNLGQDIGINLLGGKIVTDKESRTNIPNIYAVGDCVFGAPEQTPVAIKESALLVDRLYNRKTKLISWQNVPTTIFTPLEYGCVGMSQEDATEKFGEENIEVYHTSFKPLEWNVLAKRGDNSCYIKVVCDKGDGMNVVGLHFVGPNAGEVIQGYAVALSKGINIEDLQDTIGIHPTCSEVICQQTITKREKNDVVKTSC